MRVFVAGGSGAIGRRMVPQLVARGHQVTATTTDPDKRAMLEQLGATAVTMDGLDAAQVGEAVAAAEPDAVVHQMTSIGAIDMKHLDRAFAQTNRLRTEGLDHLLAAVRASGVPHVVAQSYGAWNGIRKGGWVKTESDGLDPMAGTAAEPVMAAVSRLERLVVDAGGAALRYGWLYGPGSTEILAEPVRKRQFPVVGGGAGRTSWVHLDDAASATVLAIEQRAQGVFNIVDDEPAPVSDWLPHLASLAGGKPPLRMPAWLARPFAGSAGVLMMTEGRAYSNAKAKQQLGWQPQHPSWREGFAQDLAA
ncbi:NAD-dependent epimerase/dehydratase family protein [Agrococcus baldri]|uniref:dTDP-glucose 4,6-dehydratase n=1 Tax=Agrococcus baldri TaxID=153730 RepID=A0AA87UR18_9MICO|nr:NAD(P)-dependent oxidoreductase [Agrococcus baldri]GEK79064.1 dTDP-glucose 4,6-dehydratase [Agrococcus baldri]